MKALILASGKGERQRANGDCKPLVKVMGLGLLERTILSAKRCGIFDFFVVIGYNGKKIKNYFGNGKKHGVNIKYIENNQWEKGNGVSALKAKPFFDETFILLMADHIFDHRILENLLTKPLKNDECMLCVDKTFPPYLNMDDATKILTKNGKIETIGKDLRTFNCIDTGIFKCNPVLFDALEESIRSGDEGLSGGIKVLARQNRMRYMPINGNYWIDVDDPIDLKNAEHLLCEKLKKQTDGPVSKYLNRPLSLRISKFLLKTPITPNQMTLISFAIGILGASLFFKGEYLFLVAGALLIHLHSVLDGCDGEIARLKIKRSKYGGWLDAVLDRYVDAVVIIGLVYGYWTITSDNQIWLLGFVALVGSFLNSYTGDKYDSIFKSKLRSKIRIGRDLRLLIITVGVLTGNIVAVLIVLAVVTNFEALRRLVSFRHHLEDSILLSNQ